MTNELKDAIKVLAEYMGVDKMKLDSFEIYPHSGILNYHTSADALLPVWRKVLEAIGPGWEARGPRWYWILGNILFEIAENNLPAAVIKLAEIIQQIKQK